ncbi:DUF6262 family protein [Streptomyces sp. x-19]|uniref:DUF6262 family protein n=1 Tax=Streptomyces sp. x-19 TaxID=2789280 RepID=UPI00397FB72F
MPADNSSHLLTATRRRHELTRSKAIQALRELEAGSVPITFERVARLGGISRSWLYTQPDLRSEIERLRELQQRSSHRPVPTRQRASDESLLRRLEAANHRNRELTEENQRLRRQLARALGDQRASRAPQAPRSHRGSETIGPC